MLSGCDRECLEHSPISATADSHEHIGCPLMSTQLNCIYQLNRNFSFFLSPTNSTEIENLIMSLSSTKACGPLIISTSLLKTLKSVLSVPLELLFNCSFSTGMVPDQFKVARVVPIHKKGSSCLVSNYRPISLLSIFNKLIEK